MTLTGGWVCGAVRYEADGAPFHATLCHCVDGRRASGAPGLAWFSARRAALDPLLRTACHRTQRYAQTDRSVE